MLRTTIKILGTIVLFAGLMSCTTGPQVQKDIDGTYVGAMNGAPGSNITLRVNNGTITGTGTVKDGDPIYRTGGGENDIVFSGTYANLIITDLTATISFEFNTTPGEDETDTWVAATGALTFTGEFSKSSAASGGFSGTTSLTNPTVLLGGTWIVTKSTLGTGILKP
ncbi:hypothetical protein ACFL6T_07045 [Candidatus Zixiibacteriota bacterium]